MDLEALKMSGKRLATTRFPAFRGHLSSILLYLRRCHTLAGDTNTLVREILEKSGPVIDCQPCDADCVRDAKWDNRSAQV